MEFSAPSGAPRVLVVEDDAPLRRLLEIRLSVDGYATRAACDGLDALEVLALWMPDVVLTDVMMPRMSGLSLCRAVRADARTSSIPIILLTARFFDDDIQEVMDLGGIIFMSKPFDTAALDRALREALAGNAVMRDGDGSRPAA